MKNTSSVAERQNHTQAITLIKASYRCFRAERLIKYVMIFLSFSICLAAIFNRYLPTLLPNIENLEQVQQDISTYLNLISGANLVASMPLAFYCGRMHTEGTVLRDRYDAYVFNNAENKSILRPVTDTYISIYAKKAGKDNKKFRNYIYGNDTTPEEAVAQFEYIANEARSDYNLYISIQPFFLTIWVGFCLLIVIIAVSFNDMFVTTLINIMIPSLSAITTIGNSWYNCRLQMKQLTNLITCVDKIKSLPDDQYIKYVTDKDKMRELADGLFCYRSSAFVIPNFLVKFYQRSQEKSKITITEKSTAVDDKPAESTPTTVEEQKKAKSTTSKPKAETTETQTATESKKTATSKSKAETPTEDKKPTTATKKSTVNKQTVTTPKPATTAKTSVKKPTSPKGTATLKVTATKKPKVGTAEKPTEKVTKPKTTKTTTADKTKK